MVTETFEKQFPSLKGKIFNNFVTKKDRWKDVLLIEDIQEHCLDKAKVKEVIDEDWLLFSERKRLEDEFLNWANKHNAKVCPMNVIAWFHPKIQNKIKKDLGLM